MEKESQETNSKSVPDRMERESQEKNSKSVPDWMEKENFKSPRMIAQIGIHDKKKLFIKERIDYMIEEDDENFNNAMAESGIFTPRNKDHRTRYPLDEDVFENDHKLWKLSDTRKKDYCGRKNVVIGLPDNSKGNSKSIPNRMEKENPKPLDQALESLSPKERKEYEEAIELWVTYGGD